MSIDKIVSNAAANVYQAQSAAAGAAQSSAKVHATLAELLVAADEQNAAVVAHDRDRLESVTRQQERLSARLARAESRRIELLAGEPLAAKLVALPPTAAVRTRMLGESIATQ